MAKGYSGDSKSDAAYDRMNRAMERSERNRRDDESRSAGSPIIAQLKALYPETWREELSALQRDWAAKVAAGDTGTQIKSADEYEKHDNRKL